MSGAVAIGGDTQQLFPQPEIPAFWKGRVAEIDAAVTSVKRGIASVIAVSPGGRPVRLVAFGKKVEFESQANYGSACGAGDPSFYARKPAAAPPVVFIVGPPHGQEVEGMVGLVNLLAVAESGHDLRGKAWPGLREAVDRTRLLVVPLSNPTAAPDARTTRSSAFPPTRWNGLAREHAWTAPTGAGRASRHGTRCAAKWAFWGLTSTTAA